MPNSNSKTLPEGNKMIDPVSPLADAFAIAETGWSPAARKDYPDFERRAAAFSAATRAFSRSGEI